MKKTIYLIRHGQTDDNLEHIYQGVSGDNPLNAEGIKQATLLGLWMEQNLPPPEIILSSPAQRALITAFYIHDAYKGPFPKRGIFKIADFHEINHGKWEGHSDDDVAKQWPELYKMWHENPMAVQFPCGESMRLAKKRILKAWKNEIIGLGEQTIMLVAHAGINFQIINHVLGSTKLRGTHQDNSCLNIIEELDDGTLRMKLTNGTAHLPPEKN